MNPCLPPLAGSNTHVRVNPGQEFLIEWASGHPGTDHYMIVLEASNAEKMNLHTETLLNDYISSAPASQLSTPTSKFRKMHYGWTGTPQPSRAAGT